jgi:predicted RNase H-like nuclease (RuvC/YqgF family)
MKKTKDEIREEVKEFIRYKRNFSFSDTAVISRGELIKYLTDFTYSQLKEQQEEIEKLEIDIETLKYYSDACDKQHKIIKQLEAENERLVNYSKHWNELQNTQLQSKQKEIDELREGIKIANQRVQSGAWDLDNLNDYIEELLNQRKYYE